jgi:hypothetical protein
MGPMTTSKVFNDVISALDRAGIPYMLTGSFASNLYGEGRATQDIDLVIVAEPGQMAKLRSFFPDSDYHFDLQEATEAAQRRSMFNILDMVHGWKIDLIFQKLGAYHQQAFSRRVSAEIDGVPLIAATVEDLIIAKLDWARMGESTRQIDDVVGILKVKQSSIDRTYIEKWVKELGLDSQWSRARKSAGLE